MHRFEGLCKNPHHGVRQGAEAQLSGRGLYARLSPPIGVHAMSYRVGGLLWLALLLLSSGLLWAQGGV